MVYKEKKNNSSQLKLWLLTIGLGAAVILTSLFWNSELPLFALSVKPSLYYAGFRVFQGYSSIFLNILLLIMGYSLSKSGRTNIKALLQQWTVMFIFGVLIFIVFAFGLRNAGLDGFYDMFFPLLRNVYPLVTGLFLGQLAIPVLKKILDYYDSRTIFRTALLIGVIPTFFNKDIFGLGDGRTAVFAFYMFSLGSLVALADRTFINHHLRWIAGFLLASAFLNALMPYVSFGLHVNLSTATRFVANSSALNILLAVYLFDGFTLRLQRLKVNLINTRQRQHLAFYYIGILMISTLSRVQKIIASDKKLPFGTVPQKFIVVFLEAAILAVVFFLLAAALRSLFIKVNLGQKYEGLHVLQAMEVATNDLKKFVFSRAFLTGVVFYVLSLFSMLIMNDSWTISPATFLTMNIFSYTFFIRQQLIWVNVVLIAAIFAILRLVFAGRYWLPFIITDLFVVIFSSGSKIKQSLREEPILPTDLAEAKNMGSLLTMIDSKLLIFAVFLIVIVLISGIYLEIKHRGQKLKWLNCGIYALLGILFLGSSFFVNHENAPLKILFDLVGDSRFFQNQPNGARSNGPLVQFINNVDVKVMDQPKGYSQEAMKKIYKEYAKSSQQINNGRKNNLADQTLIMTLSESFSDPTRVPGIQLSKDPMPYIRSLKKKTTSGLMISGGYGGGTANMEYMALTGFGLSNFSRTLATPYTQLVDNMNVAPSVVKSFNYSTAIHPYQGVYYNRPNVYQKFGFNQFLYLGSKTPIKYQKKIDNSNYLSDYTAYQNTLAQIKKRTAGQFINLVTMQNHLPFNAGTYNNIKIKASGSSIVNETNANNIEEYSMGMSYTDQETKKFIQQLDKVKKPITFVFYGDHLPGNYPGLSMTDNELKLHETDYFIYSNKYAREHGYGMRKLKTNSTKIVSPVSFFALAAEQSNSKVNPYLALMTLLNHKLPAYGSDAFDQKNQFVDGNGHAVAEQNLNKKQKQLLADYRLIQYDMTAGKQYLAKTDFFAK